MTSSARPDWLIPAALITLGAIPIVAGMFRVFELAGGEITSANARFFAAPLPVVLHIVGGAVYCLLGAFQFSVNFRRRRPAWHRSAGRLLVPFGLLVALSALWMNQFYPLPTANGPHVVAADFDGPAVYVMRLLTGSAMALSICLGIAAIRRRDIARHQVWMMRGYALGLAAGTQVLTHIPWFLLPDMQGESLRAVCMGAGWVTNLAVAEWFISQKHGKR